MNLTHLQQRSQEQMASLFQTESSKDEVMADILLNCSDVGVMRNGGRNGARYAPNAIINVMKKMAWHGPWNQKIALHFFHQQDQELENFALAQEKESQEFDSILKDGKKVIQIGGGHDHIYPFLKALSHKHKKIVCLNIDAHCDTRTDAEFHSGTPFRQFAAHEYAQFDLIQIGIHQYANTVSTISPVKGANLKYYHAPLNSSVFAELSTLIASLSPDTALVFSLDTDALHSSIMEGVSAVNHNGLTLEEVNKILDLVLSAKTKKYFGFYEYNPIYDNLSQKGARAIASLIYKILE